LQYIKIFTINISEGNGEMKRVKVMFIAGESSGDLLAAELAQELKLTILDKIKSDKTFSQPLTTTLEPYFFGAGGSKMKSAGIDVVFDLTKHSSIGPVDALKNYKYYKDAFDQLIELAFLKMPDLIVCVDFSGFNLRFASALRKNIHKHQGAFFRWSPKIIQYVSPQVWASRPWRARKLGENFDLLLSIFPFEKEWYKNRIPQLKVEFVGHPIIDRYPDSGGAKREKNSLPKILLLPGSRYGELKRHLPPMVEAVKYIRQQIADARLLMVLPDEDLKNYAMPFVSSLDGLLITTGDLKTALINSDVAIASTGTVTLECAYFKLPTVAIYKTSVLTYTIGKRIVNVKYLAMPNIIANEDVFPELIQHNATGENIAKKTLELLDESKRQIIQKKLDSVIQSLGNPGAAKRAAEIVANLL